MLIYTVITGTLKSRTAIHVGSGVGNDGFDALLRRDVAGAPIIPGTAIAGALRGMLTRLAPRLFEKGGVCKALLSNDKRRTVSKTKGCNCIVCHLFGDVEPSDDGPAEGEEGESAASRLLVFNSRLQNDELVKPWIRDGVGIDRATGAAARAGRAKFDLEILPKGALFDLRMELRFHPSDDQEERERVERLLAAGLAEWQAKRAWLGGNVARGLGGFELLLDDLRYRTRDLDKNEELMSFLAEDEPWESAETDAEWLDKRLKDSAGHLQALDQAEQAARQTWKLSKKQVQELPIARRWAEWDLLLEAKGPLLTNDTTSSGLSGFDHAPLLEKLGDWTQPVLPGSGLRGVLRSQAERIARTLMTHQAMVEEEGREAQEKYFIERCPACDPLARRPRPEDRSVALECCDSLLRHEDGKGNNDEISPDQLCLACQLFGSTRRGSRLIVEDASYVGDGDPTYKMLDFLAIDRFTGGGAEHFKFDALALWKPSFRLRIFLDNYEAWEMGWLMLVLRDLADGWLRVGFGGSKGFGRVKVKREDSSLRLAAIAGSPEDACEGLASLKKAQQADGSPSVYTSATYDLDWSEIEEACGWVKAFIKKLKVHRWRKEGLHLPADNFFNERVYDVYAREGGSA